MVLDHIRDENRELLLLGNSKVQTKTRGSNRHNSSLSRIANDVVRRRHQAHDHQTVQIRWPTHARNTWAAIWFYASSVNLDFLVLLSQDFDNLQQRF